MMKRHFYNTNDVFERQARRHLKHDIKEHKENLKVNKYEDEIFDENISYEDYKQWLMSN